MWYKSQYIMGSFFPPQFLELDSRSFFKHDGEAVHKLRQGVATGNKVCSHISWQPSAWPRPWYGKS